MPSDYIDRNDAISELIQSVAAEEKAIACILEAESEKIKKFLDREECHTDDVLKINKSVKDMVYTLTKLEMILESKLEIFQECACNDTHE